MACSVLLGNNAQHHVNDSHLLYIGEYTDDESQHKIA